jgi:FtsP/CotA-like multicopper oxidase with cupredoxin domain
MHVHLASSQIVFRQAFNVSTYGAAVIAANGGGKAPYDHPIQVDPTPYLIGEPIPIAAVEQGWMDVFNCPGGQITTIRIQFRPIIDQTSEFPFSPYGDAGYMIHCHMLSHGKKKSRNLGMIQSERN